MKTSSRFTVAVHTLALIALNNPHHLIAFSSQNHYDLGKDDFLRFRFIMEGNIHPTAT